MSVAVASPYPSAYPIHSEKQQQQQQQQQSRQGTASPIETKPRTVHPLRHHPLNPTAIDGLALAATVAFQEILCFPDPHVRTFSLFAKRLLNATFTATNHSNERTALSLAAAVLFSRRWASRFVSSDLQVSCEGFEFRVFTVSLLLAHKVLEDVSLVRTHEWAKVCGAVHITSGQLARMELEVCFYFPWVCNIRVSSSPCVFF
ncbi:hypothetical protein BJ741DRAFT_276662 [Chytriomyces cf. hyalinus JEL632]|nr:hypothetical protein BJ741DRAFT_276662 [Chytriomyces cf. hyalinus JEL632]